MTWISDDVVEMVTLVTSRIAGMEASDDPDGYKSDLDDVMHVILDELLIDPNRLCGMLIQLSILANAAISAIPGITEDCDDDLNEDA